MNKTLLKIGIFLFLLAVTFDVAHAALVPCGLDSEYENRCTLCHLIIGMDVIVKWGRNVMVGIALAAITFAGVMYIVSAGNQEMMDKAKTMIKQSITGLVVVLGAWLIVNTIMILLATQSDLGLGIESWDTFYCK
jgi:hypothetical protein